MYYKLREQFKHLKNAVDLIAFGYISESSVEVEPEQGSEAAEALENACVLDIWFELVTK